MSAKDVNATCLTCHSKGSHAQWNGGMHDARNVSCASCHSVHNPKSERAQLKTVTAVQTCETCHKQEAMKVKKSGHMPVREGKMDCTTCHTPHGSTNVRMLKVGNTINETCASCHAEKRGPFLHDHAAGRESCASCHDPHGSNNDRMLVAKDPMLCQRCHVSSRHPGDDLRRHADRRRQQPGGRTQLRQLPLTDPRVEPPRGRKVPSVSRQEDVMRTRLISMVAALLLIAAGAAAQDAKTTADAAQKDVPRRRRRRRPRTFRSSTRSTSASGARSFGTGSDEARFQRYRDVRDGGTLDRFRVSKDTDAYRYSLQADNVGYRDQRYSASYMNYGKVKANVRVEPDPALLQPGPRSTLYDTSTPGTLTMSDSVQTGIQNKTLTLATALQRRRRSFDLNTRRDVASFALTYSATPNVDLNVTLQEHAEDRRLPLGRQLRHQQRDRHRDCRCRWITGPPTSGPTSSTPTIAASPASATTGRSSATTSPR